MQQVTAEKLDEELTIARLYINKMKSEVKSVVHHCSQLEAAQAEDTQKLDDMEKSLSDNRLLVEQVSMIILWTSCVFMIIWMPEYVRDTLDISGSYLCCLLNRSIFRTPCVTLFYQFLYTCCHNPTHL